jgi:hypothetical protein
MSYAIKQVIDGKTYNTETATLVYDTSMESYPDDPMAPEEHSELAGTWLYQTRHGAFFLLIADHDGYPSIKPLTDADAQKFLEGRMGQRKATEALEQCFGPFPEAGAAEARLTIRIPGNLATRLANAANAKGVSINTYAMRCFERCVGAEGQRIADR